MPGSNQFETARQKMLVEQLDRRGIRSSRVLAAMGKLPRERFVSADQIDASYADSALNIDCGQTISQPYIVALMSESLELTGSESILEIGTGSGYQTAVLCELAHDVISVERHAKLSAAADFALQSLGYANYRLLVGDGTNGRAEFAPYDRIICTAAAKRVPPALFDQLAEGGMLVIPIGIATNQSLHAIRKIDGEPQQRTLIGCRFVPLVGDEAP